MNFQLFDDMKCPVVVPACCKTCGLPFQGKRCQPESEGRIASSSELVTPLVLLAPMIDR
jgi:predicted Zn-ribbon and HTH transcriptional regulator